MTCVADSRTSSGAPLTKVNSTSAMANKSPSLSVASSIFSPLTNVPFVLPKSLTWYFLPRPVMTACSRETWLESICKSAVSLRPIRKGNVATIVFSTRPSGDSRSNQGAPTTVSCMT